MSQPLIHTLSALLSLAEVEACEAALALADRLDVQAAASKVASEAQGQVAQIGDAFTRLSQPGRVVNIAAMSMLARQSMAAQADLDQAQLRVQAADEQVAQHRQWVHQQQRRQDGLQDLLRDAQRQRALQRDKKLAHDAEDLFLGRRFQLEVCK